VKEGKGREKDWVVLNHIFCSGRGRKGRGRVVNREEKRGKVRPTGTFISLISRKKGEKKGGGEEEKREIFKK